MSDTNDHDNQTGSPIEALNRLTEGRLLRFIQSLKATLEDANVRLRVLELGDRPEQDGVPQSKSAPPVGPKRETEGTED